MKKINNFVFGYGMKKMGTILVAFYLDIPLLNLILVKAWPSLANRAMSAMYIVFTGLLIGLLLFNFGRIYLRIKRSTLVAMLTIIGYILITSVHLERSTLIITNFVIYTVIPFLIPFFFELDTKLLIKSIMIFSSFGILVIDRLFIVDSNDSISMGMSYAFLATVMAFVVYAFLYFVKEKKIKKLFYMFLMIINTVYVIGLLLYGSRGPILSVIFCLIFLLNFRVREDGTGIRIVNYRFLIIGLFALVLLCNFKQTLVFLSVFLKKYDISMQIIDKSLKLYEQSSIFNGRSNLTFSALEGFFRSPIWGHGLSTFEYYTGNNYPHNFIFQLLYDGGVILTLTILIPTITSIISWFKYCNFNKYALFVFLIFLAIPGALFSGDIWENGKLWLMLSCLLSSNFKMNYTTNVHVVFHKKSVCYNEGKRRG